MTPEEFAAQTGLSLEEDEMVLSARAKKAELSVTGGLPSGVVLSRLQKAYNVLMDAQKKVGVKPYEESK